MRGDARGTFPPTTCGAMAPPHEDTARPAPRLLAETGRTSGSNAGARISCEACWHMLAVAWLYNRPMPL